MLFNKEQIKDRMLKTAARLWDVPESEIETNFDPLIILLLDACAAELEKTNQNINATQHRLLDKISEILLPDAIMNVQPASCILHAGSADKHAEVNENIRFALLQQIQQTGTKPYAVEIFFTPVGKFRLFNASLDYILCGKKLVGLLSNGEKEILYDGGTVGSNQLVNELYLAIQPDSALGSLKGLQLFFDMRGHSEANLFYDSLLGAKGLINGQPVALLNGYFNTDQFELNLQDTLGDEGNNYSKKLSRQIAWVYERHFLHVAEDIIVKPAEKLPQEWMQLLPEKLIQKLPLDKWVFIKITLSRPLHQHTLDRLVCSINAFPCMNRNLSTVSFRTDSRLNIIPLAVSGDFLDLSSVYGPGGQPYKFRISADKQDATEGEAIVRSTSIGKTNSRELRGLITGLIDDIRDESAYFSRMSNDFVLSRLKEINRILIRLEDRINIAKDNKETLHYLLLRPRNPEENVTVEYWTVNKTEEVQSMKPGMKLSAYQHALTKPGSIYTLTNAAGAKSGLTEKEKQNLLKRKIASGERIVSVEDIKLLCMQLFGENLKKTEIRKSTHPGKGKSNGFTTTIDVLLTVNNVQGEETEFIRRQLEYMLKENASPVYPFRVTLV
ncbi:MAG: type VI secretion system baseplate subunit TssF [Chitinophagaceae bacterium]|nr:type VI secretion system baseplate subunit TssF [Chitinophagaceae bacterium]